MAGVVVVATDHHASNFKHLSMRVHISPHWYSDERSHTPFDQFIIAGDDLPSFCNILPRLNIHGLGHWKREIWISTNVCVQINVQRFADVESNKTKPETDHFSVKRLLEPFRRLYGMRVRVGGHVTPSYKESIEYCAARQPPTAVDLVCMISKRREEGTQSMQSSNIATAVTTFESALDLLRSGHMRLTIHPVTVATPETPDKQVTTAMQTLEINLRCLLASSYLELGEHAKSYRCAQDLRLTKLFDRYCNLNPPEGPDWARIMSIEAMAGKVLGQPVQALMDLDLGLTFSPDDEAMKEERKSLCGFVRKKMNSDLQMNGVRALDRRTTRLKERQPSAVA